MVTGWETRATNVKTLGVPTCTVKGVEFVKVSPDLLKSKLLTNCKPAGKISFTCTPVATSGPALRTVIE